MKKLIFAALLAFGFGAVSADDVVDAPAADVTEAPAKELPREIEAPVANAEVVDAAE